MPESDGLNGQDWRGLLGDSRRQDRVVSAAMNRISATPASLTDTWSALVQLAPHALLVGILFVIVAYAGFSRPEEPSRWTASQALGIVESVEAAIQESDVAATELLTALQER